MVEAKTYQLKPITGDERTECLNNIIIRGEVFDSELHEAVANMPAEKKKDKGKIIDTIEKGYYIND